MLKILVGFILFAALALFVIMKGGDSLDMSGEKHGIETHAPAAASAPAPVAAVAVPAADAPLVELANPWKSARVVQGPNESEVFRRSVMSIVTLLAFWGFAVLVAALLGVV